jgi:hypothetical protein
MSVGGPPGTAQLRAASGGSGAAESIDEAASERVVR